MRGLPNQLDEQSATSESKRAGLYLLSSIVTGAGTQRRTGGVVEMRAGIIDKDGRRMKIVGGAVENTLFYDHII
jgi:hypothetical protein